MSNSYMLGFHSTSRQQWFCWVTLCTWSLQIFISFGNAPSAGPCDCDRQSEVAFAKDIVETQSCCSKKPIAQACCCNPSASECQCGDCQCTGQDAPAPLPAAPTSQSVELIFVGTLGFAVAQTPQWPTTQKVDWPSSYGTSVQSCTAQQTCVLLSRFTC